MAEIRDIALLAEIGDDSARRFAPAVSWRTYAAHELVIDMDDHSSDVLFVISGVVRVINRSEDGKQYILGELGPGSVFGEMAAIDGIARSATVTTLQQTRTATISARTFMDIVTSEPGVCHAILEMLVVRVRRLNRQLSEQAYLTAIERLYAELLRLSRERKGHEGQRSISPPPTQQELAERIGSRREVVSRALSALEKENLLEKTRGALVLPQPNELNRRISLRGLQIELGGNDQA